MSEAYKRAGVDIEAGYESVARIKKHVERTMRPEVLAGIGGFGALFQLPVDKYKQPVLVSGTDGVGTKLKLAFLLDKHDTIGQDAVAMCVNDIVVQGAEPLYFLDYIACGKLHPGKIEAIVSGIADGCQQAGCALIGGETAEMPGFYPDDEYDLAGFCVGIVEKDKLIDGSHIRPGDVLLGLPSSGIHSNGFSLVRKVLLEEVGLDLATPFARLVEDLGTGSEGKAGKHVASQAELKKTLGEVLLTPTRIYVKPVLTLLEKVRVKGMAHITGGGFYENIPRMLPKGTAVVIQEGSWPMPAIFQLIQKLGNLSEEDMYNTFNMGIGLVLALDKEDADEALACLEALGEKAYMIGQVEEGDQSIRFGGSKW